MVAHRKRAASHGTAYIASTLIAHQFGARRMAKNIRHQTASPRASRHQHHQFK